MDWKDVLSGLGLLLTAVLPVMFTGLGAIGYKVYQLGVQMGELKAQHAACRDENAHLLLEVATNKKKVEDLEARMAQLQNKGRRTDLKIDTLMEEVT